PEAVAYDLGRSELEGLSQLGWIPHPSARVRSRSKTLSFIGLMQSSTPPLNTKPPAISGRGFSFSLSERGASALSALMRRSAVLQECEQSSLPAPAFS